MDTQKLKAVFFVQTKVSSHNLFGWPIEQCETNPNGLTWTMSEIDILIGESESDGILSLVQLQ